jgi:hypothetical protein
LERTRPARMRWLAHAESAGNQAVSALGLVKNRQAFW